MEKVERLVNLIALLLNTRRPLTVDDIRETMPGYQHADYQSFKRMFERDKEELRAIGIPVERRFTDVWEVEEGYLISKDRYYLPELNLSPDEMAALWVAAGVVVEADGRSDQALLKLSLGAGLNGSQESPPWLRARLHLDAPSLSQFLEAVASRRRVTFAYQVPGRKIELKRKVDPYALLNKHGAWYVVGHDHLRGDVRHFKLQRITSKVTFTSRAGHDFEVPSDFSVQEYQLSERPWTGEKGISVEIAFSPRIAWWVRQSLELESSGAWKDWPAFRVPVVDKEGFVSWVIGFGSDAVVRSPASVRKMVVDRLGVLVGTN